MPPFPKPKFQYGYNVTSEITHLRQHKQTRAIPARAQNRLLIATWNIANFGVQERTSDDRKLIAEIVSWFDLFAVQETHENYGDLADVHHTLGGRGASSCQIAPATTSGRLFYTTAPRLRFSKRSVRWRSHPRTMPKFFGSDKQQQDIDRRSLETFAVAKWADREATSKTGYTRNLLVLGDFNMPKADPADPIYKALTKKGLQVPAHSSQIGSSIASDAHYDQIAFFPGDVQQAFTGNIGVFDYDQVLFPDLYQARGQKDYKTFAKYHISDHRPMWIELGTAQG